MCDENRIFNIEIWVYGFVWVNLSDVLFFNKIFWIVNILYLIVLVWGYIKVKCKRKKCILKLIFNIFVLVKFYK